MSIFLQLPNAEFSSRVSTRSNSFSVFEENEIDKPRRAISLEDITVYSNQRLAQQKYKRRRKSTQISSRRGSRTRNSRRVQRMDNQIEGFYSKQFCRHLSNNGSAHDSGDSNLQATSRRRSRYPSNTSYLDKCYAEEVMRKDRRRKKIVAIVIMSFWAFLITSVCSVVITLTHQSTAVIEKDNTTVNLTYYTFASNPDLLCKLGRGPW